MTVAAGADRRLLEDFEAASLPEGSSSCCPTGHLFPLSPGGERAGVRG